MSLLEQLLFEGRSKCDVKPPTQTFLCQVWDVSLSRNVTGAEQQVQGLLLCRNAKKGNSLRWGRKPEAPAVNHSQLSMRHNLYFLET